MKYIDVVKAMRKNASYFGQDWYRNTAINRVPITPREAQRRFKVVPNNTSGILGSHYQKADKSIEDTADAYTRFLDARKAKGLPLPQHVTEINGRYQVNIPKSK